MTDGVSNIICIIFFTQYGLKLRMIDGPEYETVAYMQRKKYAEYFICQPSDLRHS